MVPAASEGISALEPPGASHHKHESQARQNIFALDLALTLRVQAHSAL